MKKRHNTMIRQRKTFLQPLEQLLILLLWVFFVSTFFTISPSQAAQNCAKNYKNSLSQAYLRYNEPLKYAVSISHRKVDIFPGKWKVAPSVRLGDKHKRLSKKKRRRSKAGLILVPLKSPHFSASDYTAQEKQILTIADSIVRWRGKDPAFNKRGRYGWLTSRIGADLRLYMGQPAHPALCTGANLMMDHLYVNSGRFRKRVAFIQKLAPLAHQYAAARYRSFKYTMQTRKNPRFVKLGSMEKDISLSMLMTKTAKLFNNRHFLQQVDQESRFLATLALIQAKTALAANPFQKRKTRKKGALALTRLSLPQPKPAQQNQSIKTIGINQPTSAHYRANFSPTPRTRRLQLTTLQQEALRKSLSAIEAAYYIDHIAHSYNALNSAIFGAISNVKSAHKKHCRCRS